MKSIKNLLVVSLISILSACGGGGGGGGGSEAPAASGSATVLSGQVADGYLDGAIVFLDRNGNQRRDNDEPWTESGAQGYYSLNVQAGEGALYPVAAEIVAGQTIDEDQSAQAITKGYHLETPAGQWTYISPLTTLVKNEMDEHPSQPLAEAESSIRSQLGLSNGISLFEDYVNAQNNPGLIGAHHVASLVASLMGNMQTEIEQNVGRATAENQGAAIALLIGDQIMNNHTTIAQGLASAPDTNAIEALKASILAGINTTSFDSALLDRYLARMQMPNNPVWDMTPPKILGQTPAVDGSTSINSTITLTFDEALAPTTINDNTIQLSGPNGPVAGTVSYDATRRQLSFVPTEFLMAFATHQVALSVVNDAQGNSLEQPKGWSFTTIFDQLPPALPDF